MNLCPKSLRYPNFLSKVQSTLNLIEVTTEGRVQRKITFEPLCRLEYAFNFSDNSKQFGFVTYCIPVSLGKFRIIILFARNFAKTLYRLKPRWWNHISDRNLDTSSF